MVKKLLIVLSCLLAFILASVLISLVFQHVRQTSEQELAREIGEDYGSHWISRSPWGPRVQLAHPGDQLFFDVRGNRTQICVIESGFRWELINGPVAKTVWPGERLPAMTAQRGSVQVSNAIRVPADLLPGSYRVVKSLSYICDGVGGQQHRTVTDIVVPLTIR